MFNDVETIRQWTRIALTIAAIPVTAFPLLYLVFAPWYKSQLGRAMMLQSMAIAFAIDFSLIYQYWVFTSSLHVLLTIRLFMFVFIGLAALYLTTMLVYYLFNPQKVGITNVEQPSGDAGKDALSQ
jgi:hypothetical protein